MSNPPQIVIASSDPETQERVTGILDRLGLDAICVSTVKECREIRAGESVGLIFCDRSLNDGGYREVLAAACKWTRGKARVVLMASLIEPHEYRAAKQSGLFEVIAAPCRPTDVEWMVILAKREERVASATLNLTHNNAS